MLQKVKDFLTNSSKPTKIPNYYLDFKIVQRKNMCWTFELYVLPYKTKKSFLNKSGKDSFGKQLILPCRETFTEWEYAAEAAIDTIELMGFQVDGKYHEFDVYYRTAKTKSNALFIIQTGIFVDNEFSLKG